MISSVLLASWQAQKKRRKKRSSYQNDCLFSTLYNSFLEVHKNLKGIICALWKISRGATAAPPALEGLGRISNIVLSASSDLYVLLKYIHNTSLLPILCIHFCYNLIALTQSNNSGTKKVYPANVMIISSIKLVSGVHSISGIWLPGSIILYLKFIVLMQSFYVSMPNQPE